MDGMRKYVNRMCSKTDSVFHLSLISGLAYREIADYLPMQKV